MEYLRLLLPRAGDMGESLVATRPYRVTAYLNRNAGAITGQIGTAQYVPSLASLRASVILGAQYLVDLPGDNGSLPLNLTWTADIPLVIEFTNLSVDAEVWVTIPIGAKGYGASMGRD